MSETRIYLFGPPRIERDKENIEINRRKAAALIAYLVVNAQPYSRDSLATLLWPEHDQSGARGSLRRELSRLKKMLDVPILAIDRETVGLRNEADVWLDVQEFQNRLAAVQSHNHGNHRICSTCAESLQKAVALYGEDFMAGFSLPDSPNYDDWQFFQGDELRRALSDALEKLIDWYAGQGQFEQAIDLGKRLVEMDRLHEPAQRKLMKLFAWADQQAAAIRQYQELERTLKDELDLEPDEDTIALFEAIKERRLEAPEVSPPRETPDTAKSNLPADVSAFIGRESEQAELLELLGMPQARMITIVGLGGMGKTRLAINSAQQLIEKKLPLFSDGVVYVSLAGVEAPNAMPAALAKTLGLSLAGQVAPIVEVMNYLQDRQMLLILDNFEQLLDSAQLLNQVLESCPGVKLLLTSREPLRLEGEWRYDLEGLPFPVNQTISEDEHYASVQLFIQTAQQIQPDFQLTSQNRAYVYRICYLVSGVPLAIKLAATWLRVMTAQQIVSELENSIDILTSQYRDIPARQHSIRAVFESTWNLLQPIEKTAFARLSVFRGGFSEQAAFQVAEVSPFQLVGLVDHGLIHFAKEGRYEIHELTRQFAVEKNRQSGQLDEIAGKHSRYYFEWIAHQHDPLHGKNPLEALKILQSESDNLSQAWNWAVNNSPASIPMNTAETFAAYYEFSGLLSEGERAFKEAIQQLIAKPNTGETSQNLAYLCSRHIKFRIYQGKWDDFDKIIFQAQELTDYSGNVSRSADLDFYRGMKLQHSGDLLQAMEEYQKAAEKYQAQDDLRWLALTLSYIGEAFSYANQPDKALASHQQALDIAEQLGDARMRAFSLSHMGVAYYYRDEYSQAIQHWEWALEIFNRMDESRGIGRTLNNLAFVHAHLGNYQKALHCSERSIAILHQIGDLHNEANAYDTLGEIHYYLGNFEEARKYYQQAMKYNQGDSDLNVEEAMFRTNIALLDIASGNYGSAEEHLEHALRLVTFVRHPKEIAKTKGALAALYHETGRSQQALQSYEQAIECLQQIGEQNELVPLLLSKARLHYELNELENAAELTRKCLQLAQNSQHHLHLRQARTLLAQIEKTSTAVAKQAEL